MRWAEGKWVKVVRKTGRFVGFGCIQGPHSNAAKLLLPYGVTYPLGGKLLPLNEAEAKAIKNRCGELDWVASRTGLTTSEALRKYCTAHHADLLQVLLKDCPGRLPIGQR